MIRLLAGSLAGWLLGVTLAVNYTHGLNVWAVALGLGFVLAGLGGWLAAATFR